MKTLPRLHKMKGKRYLLWHLSTVPNVEKKYQIRLRHAQGAELQSAPITQNSVNFADRRLTRNVLYAPNVANRWKNSKILTRISSSTTVLPPEGLQAPQAEAEWATLSAPRAAL